MLCTSYRADDAWKRLETYFDRSRHLAEGNDTDLHVLCIQCFEVRTYIVKLHIIISGTIYDNEMNFLCAG